MSFSERPDYSAEDTKEPGLRERLIHERDSVGSTRAYLRVLGVYYESVPDHAANMLQLKRMAGMVTNPNSEPSFPTNVTNAFYWGEILAYNAQERLLGDTWASNSYKLFSRNIIATMKDTWKEKMPHSEAKKRVADVTVDDLETVDSGVMSPLLDQFIIEWSGEITNDLEEQWQIILGFRYIIMQIEQAPPEYGIATFNYYGPELSESAQAARTFFEMMDETEIDDVPDDDVESIDDIRDSLMEFYADQRMVYGAFDETDNDAVDDVAIYLMQVMNSELVKTEGIEEEQLVEVTGHAIFMVYDDNLNARNVYILGKDECIRGTIEEIAVTDVPSFEAVAEIRRSRNDPDRDELYSAMKEQINPLGVVLVLRDPIIINARDEPSYMPPGIIAGVVMNNPDMHMKKYSL